MKPTSERIDYCINRIEIALRGGMPNARVRNPPNIDEAICALESLRTDLADTSGTPVSVLGLGFAAVNALETCGVHTVEQLKLIPVARLQKIPQLSLVRVSEIVTALQNHIDIFES